MKNEKRKTKAAKSTHLRRFSGLFLFTDEVIRYLLVAKDPRREKMLAKRQERKVQEEAKEEE